MSDIGYIIIAGIFLPLFPLSMVFNNLAARIPSSGLRVALLLVWPHIGLLILQSVSSPLPGWLTGLALATSMFYGLRMLALQDVGQWINFLATSLWALLWVVASGKDSTMQLHIHAIAITAPLLVLELLRGNLQKQFGAAYSGLHGGLAQSMPRFAGVLVVAILAAVATPLFPTFFFMLEILIGSNAAIPYAMVMLLVSWLLWSWAGARLVQGLIVGADSQVETCDLGRLATWCYVLALLVLAVAGIYLAGGLL